MAITPEQREHVAGELKRFATSLNLSEEQKQKLNGFLTDAYEKVETYRQQNPSTSREELVKKVADQRGAIRERLVNFLTPDQLKTWDTEMSRAKEFLGQRMAA